MMKITVELSTLNKEQRGAVADFILSFPTAAKETEPEGDEYHVEIPAFTVPTDEPETETEQTPAQAFTTGLVLVAAPPAAVTAVPAPPAAASTVDKAGLPWDERIHASSRTLTADGCWRKKRGVSDGLVTEVETQLRSLMALPAPVAAPAPPPAAPVAAAVPAPPPPAQSGKDAYVRLISKASAAIVAKQLTQDQVNSAVIAAGVPSLPLLANRVDLVPQVEATLDTLIAANVA